MAPPAILACRLRVTLPQGPWVQGFSRAHPEVQVEVLNRLDLGGGRTLTEVRVHASSSGSWAQEIRKLPGVSTVELLTPEGEDTEFRVVHRTSMFVPVFRELQLLRRFPFPIVGGVATWFVVGPEERVRQLIVELRERAPEIVVESVRHDAARGEGLLTPRQGEVFRRAMAAGYFEVPRRITLTALAHEMGMAISSLSESLAIIEKKLLEARTGPG